ncbi:hypothetical protein [Catenulispora subtropica]|uniref:Integral membrane protein n=1 Tax=Catenulispora subtropica TaxID=450798 RepID=A0ABN2TAW9_9ACTN
MSSTPVRSHARPTPTAPWILVAAVIAGAVILGAALIAGSVPLLAVGAVVILAAGVCAVALTRRGAAPFSFTEEFPEHTYGPRATEHGDSSPPIDTEPHRPPGPPHYRTMEEVDAGQMSAPPDDQRVFPQYSNLRPDERLRNVGGREVIERAEVPEPDENVRDTEPDS